MCIICVEYNKGRLTTFEAKRNFLEMIETLDIEHAREVEALLRKHEEKEREDE